MCIVTQSTPLQTGELVALKSGGPAMTITALSGDCAYCVWFNQNEQRQGTFALNTLERISEAAVHHFMPASNEARA